MVCVVLACPSQWRGGLVYKGMDKGSFDDVTSFIWRRHQINLCLSLLQIYGPSSSSSTSSSPSASCQRKSAFLQMEWVGMPIKLSGGMALLWECYSYNVTSNENAMLGQFLISRKDYCLQTRWVTSALSRQRHSHFFNKMDLLLPFSSRGHSGPRRRRCPSRFKMSWI